MQRAVERPKLPWLGYRYGFPSRCIHRAVTRTDAAHGKLWQTSGNQAQTIGKDAQIFGKGGEEF